MKKFLIQVSALLVVIIVLVVYDFNAQLKVKVGGAATGSSSISQVKIDDTLVNVEVAATPEQRAQGLGGRDSLASDSGMLFVFPIPDKYTFWMKGMKIPLDFIWINQEKVVDLLPSISPPDPGTADSNLLRYQPVVNVDKVLEVNSGFIAAHNIKVGDTVEYISK